jgi:hypothetical protein
MSRQRISTDQQESRISGLEKRDADDGQALPRMERLFLALSARNGRATCSNS